MFEIPRNPAPLAAMSASSALGLSCLDHKLYALLAYRLSLPEEATTQRVREAATDMRRHLLALQYPKQLHVGSDTETDAPQGATFWREVSLEQGQNALHPDFMPIVGRILNGGDEADACDKKHFYGMPPLSCVSPHFLSLPLLLNFKGRALDRLKQAGVPAESAQRAAVTLADATLFTFASGIAILGMGLKISVPGSKRNSPLPAALLSECLYLLGHSPARGHPLQAVQVESRIILEHLEAGASIVFDAEQRYGARLLRPGEPEATLQEAGLLRRGLLHAAAPEGAKDKKALLFPHPIGETNLADLADLLLGIPTCDSFLERGTDGGASRLFTYAAAVFAEDATDTDLDRQAYRLSRRFGAEYQIEPDEVTTSVLRPFANIRHAMATQGGAVTVRSSDAEFVRNFANGAVPGAYLPLALLAYHEYQFLLELSQESAFLPEEGSPADDAKRIRALSHDMARFRLYFRFSHVSNIAHHNTVHRGWREALDLDRMVRELALDVNEADRVLARLENEAREKRWALWGAAIAFLSTFVLLRHAFEWIVSIKKELPEGEASSLPFAIAAFVIALIAGAVAYSKGPKPPEED